MESDLRRRSSYTATMQPSSAMEVNPALSGAAPDGDADADAAKANSSDDTICDAVLVCIDCYRRLC
jgi:hypothetical protein